MLTLSSSAFAEGGRIPERYTCDGERSLSPPLSFAGVPGRATSLALTMEDPDIPDIVKARGIEVFDHWILYDIPPNTIEIPEGGRVGKAGVTSAGTALYTGPCPPREHEPAEHRYIFTLYALDVTLMLAEGANKKEVLAALAGRVLEQATLTGRYRRPS